ncbi:MAG: carbamoyltransferase [Pseudomonadota bacterium]
MNILGISCFYHDSAACLLQSGVPVAAASEERFTRRKHDSGFPVHAARFVLEQAGLDISQVEAVAFYDKPMRKFERLLVSQVHHFPRGSHQFLYGTANWLTTKLRLPAVLEKHLGYQGPIFYADHHLSHAASAFYCSGWEHAAVLTVDGVGEWSTATWGAGHGLDLQLEAEIRFPHSLGLLYSAFTWYLGFKVNSAEYKVMGLAPYGEPRYVDKIRELIQVAEDGSFRLDMRYFTYDWAMRMFNPSFEALLGQPRRELESGPLTQFHKDVARSLQEVVDDVMVRLATSVVQRTGERRLCLAGGVALNCVANGHILRRAPVDDLFIQPAAGDAGGAMGAAYWVWHALLRQPRQPRLPSVYLGPGFDEDAIRQVLDHYGAVYRRCERQELLDGVAERIDQARVVGWFQGRMEWGPRALGHRTILADARHPEMRDTLNWKIKKREGFRPFAPSVLEDKVSEVFELDRPSPYMLLVAQVREGQQLPAITHVDGSARIQTINQDEDALYYDLVSAFHRLTGCPVVVNTSMNVRGEPIVCTPEDAYLCFMRTDMDDLAMGPYLLAKEEQPELAQPDAKSLFGLD